MAIDDGQCLAEDNPAQRPGEGPIVELHASQLRQIKKALRVSCNSERAGRGRPRHTGKSRTNCRYLVCPPLRCATCLAALHRLSRDPFGAAWLASTR